jgi:hypothetical protein
MALIESTGEHWNSPIEVVERMATDNELPFERAVQDEIALVVSGKLTDYQVSFTWMHEIEVLHLACAFEMKVPGPRSPEVQQLIVTINEQLWIGHFDVWMQSGMVMFRHALLLVGGGGLSARQCEAMFGSALDTCERYFPAFQFVVWAGKSAREAVDAVMFETCGQANDAPGSDSTFRRANHRVHARTDARRVDLVIAHFPAVCCPYSDRNRQ